jgi:hypothetical protein
MMINRTILPEGVSKSREIEITSKNLVNIKTKKKPDMATPIKQTKPIAKSKNPTPNSKREVKRGDLKVNLKEF